VRELPTRILKASNASLDGKLDFDSVIVNEEGSKVSEMRNLYITTLFGFGKK
jgi:hypothetical protein